MPIAIAALLGLGIGHLVELFLDLAYSDQPLRLPRWRCNGCRAPLAHRSWVPLAGYLLAGGRCDCGRRLPPRGLVLPLAAAALFAGAVASQEEGIPVVLTALFGLLFVALAITDLERLLIPNRIVYPALLLAATVSWLWPDRGVAAVFLGGGLALAVTLAVYLLSRGSFGAGDVKMALLMGLVVGYPAVVVGGFVTALSAGAVAALLLLTGVICWRQYIPYGPFIALGGLVALFLGA